MTKQPIKRMYVASEMIAAGKWPKDMFRKDEIDEITLSLGVNEDFKWEFTIGLIRIGDSRTALKAMIFSDAWKVFDEAPEIFRVMKAFGNGSGSGQNDVSVWPQFLRAFEEAGWKRVKPEPKKEQEPKVCTACGK